MKTSHEEIWKCEDCGYENSIWTPFDDETEYEHNCIECNSTNLNRIKLKKPKEKCPLCPKEYQSRNDLDEHLKKIHGLSIANIKNRTEKEKSEFIEQCTEILDEIK